MKIEVPEAEILRTPIKIKKLSLWNRSGSGFIENFEFYLFLETNTSPIHLKDIYFKEIYFKGGMGTQKGVPHGRLPARAGSGGGSPPGA